jgi:transcriptional regulator with XRE-family HTH domain
MISGDKMRFLRQLHNISEKKMSEMIGKSDRWIRKIESGEEIPTNEVYTAYMNALYGRVKKKPTTDTKKAPVKKAKKDTK